MANAKKRPVYIHHAKIGEAISWDEACSVFYDHAADLYGTLYYDGRNMTAVRCAAGDHLLMSFGCAPRQHGWTLENTEEWTGRGGKDSPGGFRFLPGKATNKRTGERHGLDAPELCRIHVAPHFAVQVP